MSEMQQYNYEPNRLASSRGFSLRKNGAWVACGSSMRNGERLLIGTRNQYYDYSF